LKNNCRTAGAGAALGAPGSAIAAPFVWFARSRLTPLTTRLIPMQASRYNITIDRGSGAVTFDSFVIRHDTKHKELLRALRHLSPRDKPGAEQTIGTTFGPGSFYGLPCSGGPVWGPKGLVTVMIAFGVVDLQMLGAVLRVELGVVLQGQPEFNFPWGSLFVLRTDSGGTAIIHNFRENMVEPEKPEPEPPPFVPTTPQERLVGPLGTKYLPMAAAQIASPATPEVGATFQQLRASGLEDWQAEGLIAVVLASHMETDADSKGTFDYARYVADLRSRVASAAN
jgi:hypothetical protein